MKSNASQTIFDRHSISRTFGLFWGCLLFAAFFVSSVYAADPSSEQIEQTFKRLIISFQNNDYAAFQKIAKGMPVDFSVRHFTKLHRLLRSFGMLQRYERAPQDAKEGDKKGVLYRLFYPNAQFHLMLAFQDGRLARFRFGGRALEERIRALEEEAKRKLALIDFELLNNAGFPHLQSGPLPAGTFAYRTKLIGLKPKAGFLRARVDIHLRYKEAPSKILQTGKSRTIMLPPTILQPVWTLQGKITLHEAGRYTIILIATDENNGQIARLEHQISIQAK